MAIKWRKDLEIGVEEVDNQHKALFKQVNNLLESCSEGRSKEEIGKTLDFLSNYVVTHFETEENYQRKYGYPQYEEHLKLHKDFLEEVKELRKRFNEQGISLQFTIQFNKKVVRWLVDHIGKADRQLGQFLREKIK